MKKTLQMILLIAAGLAAGALLHEWQAPHPPEGGEKIAPVIDTIAWYDTIPYYLPAAKQEVALGPKITFLPVFIPRDSFPNGELRMENEELSSDSVAVEIPITQREYEGADYRAWVSGYEPMLDSIFVFPRHDVVTIREPSLRSDHNDERRRWGLGVFAGYGVTPHGMQPCVGISINYNLWNF